MKRLCYFVAFTILSMLGFQGYAQDVNQATVKVSGQFYTVSAQEDENPRNEAFSFASGDYDNMTQDFTFTPDVTYTIKLQNAAESYYVFINGLQIPSKLDEGVTGYQADVVFNNGDVVEIYENTPYMAHVVVNGQFYTLSAQDIDEPRNEAFAFGNGNYMYEGREFTFAPGVTYAIKAQNENNSFYVYVNGVAVANELDADATGFEGHVQFHSGDAVEIYEYTPYVANVTVNGQFYTISAQGVDDNRQEAFAFTNDTYTSQYLEFEFEPGVNYQIKAQNESNSIYVYVNGEALANELDADATGYQATVKFNAGDEVAIYENTPYVGTVIVNGQFYTINAQGVDNPRDEAFTFTNAVYDNETRSFDFNPATTYAIKIQNASNNIYVLVNGQLLANELDADATGYQAEIEFNADDVVEITETNPFGAATVSVSGSFYTIAAQDVDDPRNEAFAFTYGTYDNETREFTFSAGTVYELKMQNESNQFYVYVNGVELANEYSAEAGETGYKATVEFNDGDVVEIFESTPYVAHVVVNGQFYTIAAQDVDEPRNEAFAFGNGNYMYEGREFTFAPGVTYAIKAQNENNSIYVYVNGVAVANVLDADATGFEGHVQFHAGDAVEIYEYTPYVANVTVTGQFYTIAAQGVDDNRQEAFAFTNATYDNESVEFEFEPGVTYQIKIQNASNSIYVYVNGEVLANELDADATGYQADIVFHAGDEIEICENNPYVATVVVNGTFYTIAAQDVDEPRNEAFSFAYGTYENETLQFSFNPGTTYAIKAQNPNNTFAVYVNDVLLANELDADQTGYQAEIEFNAGDVVKIYDQDPSGLNNITVDNLFEGRIYNMQGIEIKVENLTPGFYIVNGVKTFVR